MGHTVCRSICGMASRWSCSLLQDAGSGRMSLQIVLGVAFWAPASLQYATPSTVDVVIHPRVTCVGYVEVVELCVRAVQARIHSCFDDWLAVNLHAIQCCLEACSHKFRAASGHRNVSLVINWASNVLAYATKQHVIPYCAWHDHDVPRIRV